MNGAVLRLIQTTTGTGSYEVRLELDRPGRARRAATCRFAFALSDQEQADQRWYLEDYLSQPFDPAPLVAARVERQMQAAGERLFRAVLRGNDDATAIWDAVKDDLAGLRLEVASDLPGATELPWELLAESAPAPGRFLALEVGTFARSYAEAGTEPHLPAEGEGAIRILLAICRPGRRDDVPFRSVAMRLVKGLAAASDSYQLDVLRPATYERLTQVLRDARSAGRPYHVLHFDGHGAFLEMEKLFREWPAKGAPQEVVAWLRELVDLDVQRFSPQAVYPDPRRPGRRGYLVFENPASEYNLRLVDGPALGALLVETRVPVLVLNACRSAHAESAGDVEPGKGAKPDGAAPPGAAGAAAEAAPAAAADDPHAQVRALGSLAQEVMDAGVAGVVAMRYNVYVTTAARFVGDLYAALAGGASLGEAVTRGRKQLHADPLRSAGYEPVRLQDWPVPVVYEAAPLHLFRRPAAGAAPALALAASAATPGRGDLDPSLPPPPDAGFYGRDETLLALDRAFDGQQVVLLHGYAGSGKTATAAEFARWYALTGGVNGPVLWTGFEQHRSLARVLDQLGALFGPALERSGVQWLALDDEERRRVALQVLGQVPVLWVWDNVEPVAGFPAGSESAWTPAEQRALAGFLRAARSTKARFLLTSRRDERAWLGDLPQRVALPPMPKEERVALARALAEKHGRPLGDLAAWLPLLRFSDGNPLALTVLVGHALRRGLRTKDQVVAFVAELRAGTPALDDDEAEGRSRSLAASLGYGFQHAFDEAERRVLALLHLFQGFVAVDALRIMGGDPSMMKNVQDWHLPELRGLDRGTGMALLDRAAEIGLLEPRGGGYYAIHPALPWYFRGLFEAAYAPPRGEAAAPAGPAGPSTHLAAARAYVEAIGELGNYCHHQYGAGRREVVDLLRAEEANLLHARHLAREHGWWDAVMRTMQGLDQLYDFDGRRADWARLVAEIVPDFVDPATDGPLPGRDEDWGLVTQYRVLLAHQARQWAEAERLQRLHVDWDRRRAAPALATLQAPAGEPDAGQRHALRTLAVSLSQLADILREQGKPECVEPYQEDYNLSLRINDQPGAAVTAFNLGHAYKDLPALRDLDRAEGWYRRSLELRAEGDRLGRGQCVGQLGYVAWERFRYARATNRSKDELLRHPLVPRSSGPAAPRGRGRPGGDPQPARQRRL